MAIIDDKKIQELPESNSIGLTDQMIVETVDGTKLVDIATIKKLINANFIVDNIEKMKSASFKEGEVCITLGYRTAGDGGAAVYKIVYDPALVEDKANIHYLLTSDTNRAKFISLNNLVTPEQFGAYGDGKHDDSDAITKCIKSGYKVIFRPNANYAIKKPLPFITNMNIDFNGCTIIPYGCSVFDIHNNSDNDVFENICIVNGNIDASNAYDRKNIINITAYTNNLVIDNINIDGIDNNTAILIANETGAVIQNCKINGIRTLSNSTGIYSETVIDSELNRSNSLKISNCIFNNLFLPIIIKGKTSKNEEFVIENCFGNNTIKISNASFITVTDCICKIENNTSLGYTNHILVNSKDQGALVDVHNATAKESHYLLQCYSGQNINNKINISGNIFMTKSTTETLENNEFCIYGAISGTLYHSANIDKAINNGFTEGSSTTSRYTYADIKDIVPAELKSIKSISTANIGTTNILNRYVNVSSALTITALGGGVVGQVIRLMSTGNAIIKSNNLDIQLSQSSIQLSATNSILLKKITNRLWRQI